MTSPNAPANTPPTATCATLSFCFSTIMPPNRGNVTYSASSLISFLYSRPLRSGTLSSSFSSLSVLLTRRGSNCSSRRCRRCSCACVRAHSSYFRCSLSNVDKRTEKRNENYHFDDNSFQLRTGMSGAAIDLTSSATMTDIYTSTTNPSVVQSILLANDDGTNDVKARVVWTNGSDTIQAYLCYDLVVPADSTVELCEKPKYLAAGYKLRVYANQADRLEVTASGKQITS